MAWPLSQEYNEAIQAADLCFRDPDLRQAQARTNALGLPMPCSGNFADVYEMTSPGGKDWAVKCFTRQVPGLAERYAAISAYLKQVDLPFMVDFTFLEPGINVHGQWYPILKMHWVEGLTLNAFVKQQADNPGVLEGLGAIWLRLSRRLREAKLAHADLQHGNILLVQGKGRHVDIKLIDYDGMFVSALAGQRSGEVGHPAYQHPQRLREGTYSAEVDRFPQLVIYTALRSLMVGGRYLWNKYDNGDNLLFRQADLDQPDQSVLFAELMQLGDAEVRKLVQTLAQSAQQPLEQTPLVAELVGGRTQRKSSAVPAGVGQDETPGVIFAQAAAGDRMRRPRRSAQRSYVGVMVAGVVVLAGLIVGGMMMGTNRKPKDTGPQLVVVQPPPMTTKKPPDSPPVMKLTNSPPKPEPTPSRAITNSIDMKLLLIPAGKFTMGSPKEEKGRRGDEEQHEVEITRPFYMGVHPVTVGQFRAFVRQDRYRTEAEKGGRGTGYDEKTGKLAPKPEYTWTNPGWKQTDEHPVVNVSWNDAVAFCEWLSKKDGQKYRLPTEAEWEHACRAGTTTRYYSGDDDESLQAVANVADASLKRKWSAANWAMSWDDGYPFTAPVGWFKANAFGLHDMHGNVIQWCADWYDKDYYKKSPRQDPPGPDTGVYRVGRGGSFERRVSDCRSASRLFTAPWSRWCAGGLRVVRAVPARAQLTEPAPEPAKKDLTNSSGMKFVRVPRGTFWMGGGGGKPGDRQVEIARDFELGVYAVTQEQWQAVMGSNPSHFSRTGSGADRVKDISDADLKQFPVETVSWDDAQHFIQELNAREKGTGWVYRLPTESEWEYACRGGATSKKECAFHYYFDQPTNDLFPSQANFTVTNTDGSVAKGQSLARTTKVGSYRPNRLGLYDMHGNVSQWCEDADRAPAGNEARVRRGGSWKDFDVFSRAAEREINVPIVRTYHVGFRVARVPSAVKPKDPTDSKNATITNSIGMNLVLIPAGKFLMGSPRNEEERGNDEEQHEVEITRAFHMGVYLVTQGEYEKVIGRNPSRFSAVGGGKAAVRGMDTARFPVETVSWDEAVEFCRRLSDLPEEKKAGRTYRLPTEAEWEYACRAGTTTPFHYGNSLSSEQANFNGNRPYGGAAKGKYLERTTAVGSYQPNAFGLYDMHGNDRQWCADRYDANYYSQSPRQDPQGAETGDRRVVRGGSWYSWGGGCRAANRVTYSPGNRNGHFGFRVVCVAAPRTR